MKEFISKYIVAIAENDDHHAFDELFRYYFPGLLSYCRSLVKEEAIALDLIQDLFFKIWVNRKTLTSIDHFSAYLYTSLKFNALHFLERKKKEMMLQNAVGEGFALNNITPDTILTQKETVKKLIYLYGSFCYKLM